MFAQAFNMLQAMTGSVQSTDPVDAGRSPATMGFAALPLPGAALTSGAGTGSAATFPAVDIMAIPGLDIMSDAADYWIDSTQRWFLYWDCLRRAGNAFLETDPDSVQASSDETGRMADDAVYDDWSVDGLTVRAVRPDDDIKLDPAKRPIVFFDPRAGTEAGAGELNDTVRRSLYAGHFVYRVHLAATDDDNRPGRETLETAEAAILEQVASRHPAATRPPCRIGRCADIPALAALSLLEAECVGAEPIDAVPSSYWCGLDPASPFRDSAALLGGQWLASLDRDLGNGRQDGCTAAAVPYLTDTATRLWTEPYALYADIDTAERTYLRHARRRDTQFRRRTDAVRFHVGGPGLAGGGAPAGTMVLDDGRMLDIRTAARPVLLFATDHGRAGAPEALARQVKEAFGSVQAIKDAGRAVIFRQDEATGQLAALIMPVVAGSGPRPGLYELVARPVSHPDAGGTPVQRDIEVTLVPRSFRGAALFQDRAGAPEPALARAADFSEAADWFYKITLRPALRNWATRSLSEIRRNLHPVRAWRAFLSDINPVMATINRVADLVREDRRPAAQDNDFVAAEKACAQRLRTVLATVFRLRDQTLRTLYRFAFENPAWSMVGR